MSRSTSLLWVLMSACATTGQVTPTAEAPKKPAAAWVRTAPPEALPEAGWVEPQPFETTLKNGLRVVVLERHERPLVSIRLMLSSGAASESATRAGATWLALNLLEDRFERRNDVGDLLVTDEKSARGQLALRGGELGAGVSPDASWLSVDGYARDAVSYLESLMSVIKARRRGIDGFTGRRNALLDRLEDRELSDTETLVDQLSRLSFGPQHPYSQSVLGTLTSLNQLGMEDISARQDAILRPKGATLVIGGDVDHEQILARASAIFRNWEAVAAAPPELAVAPTPVSRRKVVHVIPRAPARTTTLCAVRPLGNGANADAALTVLAHTVGGALQQVLREDNGFTYTVQASVLRHRFARAFAVCTSLPTAKTGEALEVFTRTIKALQTTPPSTDDVNRAKAVVRSRLALARSDVRSLVSSWASAIELAQPPALEPHLQAVERVTQADVEKLARTVLNVDQLQLLMSGDEPIIDAAVKRSGLGPSARIALERYHPQ